MINEQRLVYTFLELVPFDSPSGGEKGTAESVAIRLRALGSDTQVDSLRHVVAKINDKGKALLLNAHIDNVHPAFCTNSFIGSDRIRSDCTTVLGADDLAGVAGILEAATAMVAADALHVPLEIAITSQEEMGLIGAKGLDLTQFRAREGVVFDSAGPVGNIVIASPAHNQNRALFDGKAAHSGLEPEKGINALKAAAKAIYRIKLGRIENQATANIGILKGGTARNVVPEQVELTGEARSRNLRKLQTQSKAMKEAMRRAARAHSALVDVQVVRAYNGYKFAKSDKTVYRVAKALQKTRRKPTYSVTGGGSDANVFNAKRIKCVVTSVGYEQIHTTSEYVPIAELVKTAELVVALATII